MNACHKQEINVENKRVNLLLLLATRELSVARRTKEFSAAKHSFMLIREKHRPP